MVNCRLRLDSALPGRPTARRLLHLIIRPRSAGSLLVRQTAIRRQLLVNYRPLLWLEQRAAVLGRVKRGTHALLFRFLVCLGFPYRLQEHLAGGRFAARLVVEGVLVAPEVRDHLAKKVVGTLLDLLPFLLFFHLLQRKKDSYRLSEFTTAIMRSYLYLHLILMQEPFVPIGV